MLFFALQITQIVFLHILEKIFFFVAKPTDVGDFCRCLSRIVIAIFDSSRRMRHGKSGQSATMIDNMLVVFRRKNNEQAWKVMKNHKLSPAKRQRRSLYSYETRERFVDSVADSEDAVSTPTEQKNALSKCGMEGMTELTHNYGTLTAGQRRTSWARPSCSVEADLWFDHSPTAALTCSIVFAAILRAFSAPACRTSSMNCGFSRSCLRRSRISAKYSVYFSKRACLAWP